MQNFFKIIFDKIWNNIIRRFSSSNPNPATDTSLTETNTTVEAAQQPKDKPIEINNGVDIRNESSNEPITLVTKTGELKEETENFSTLASKLRQQQQKDYENSNKSIVKCNT